MFFTNKIPLFSVYFVHKVKFSAYIRLFLCKTSFYYFPEYYSNYFFVKFV